jgi:nucleoside-diphosphate-sugar epimerase
MPPPSNREPGVDYVAADLGQAIDPSIFSGVSLVVHCAAETAGGKAAHDRNTVAATRNLLDASAANRVTRFLHISSIAVLKPGREVGGALDEQTPVDAGNLSRGPYVWAKAEAERDVLERGPALGLDIRVIRPGPLVDFDAYTPPGRLGRELGPVFVAIGPRNNRLSLCAVRTAAEVVRAGAADFDLLPPILNLVEPDAPTRDDLLQRWLRMRPDLGAMWVPGWVLAVLSPVAMLAQRILRPKATPVDVAAAFASERYDTTQARRVIDRARAMPLETVQA